MPRSNNSVINNLAPSRRVSSSAFIILFFGALTLLAGCNEQAGNKESRPQPPNMPVDTMHVEKRDLSCTGCNIILLNIELLRADFVGLLSPGKNSATPNIDRFFAHSVIFEQVSAPAGESYRSNIAVQTGMHAFRYSADQKSIDEFARRGFKNPSAPRHQQIASMLTRYTTIAEALQKNNYHTINLNQGIRAGNRLLLDRGFDESVNWGRIKTSFHETVAGLENALSQTREKFFVLYRPEALHPFPYYYPDDRKRFELPGKIFYQEKSQYQRYNVRFNPALAAGEKRKVHRMIYRQQLKYIDDEMGKVFNKITQERLDQTSIIVLYSNHGVGLGDNGVHKLAVSYQSCIRVPLLIRIPSLDEQIRISTPVSLIDLAPTLFEIAAIDYSSDLDGRSLLHYSGTDSPISEPIIGRNDDDEYIRVGDWKLIIKNGEQREIYNLRSDPHETRSLYASQASVARDLESRLVAIKIELLQDQTE